MILQIEQNKIKSMAEELTRGHMEKDQHAHQQTHEIGDLRGREAIFESKMRETENMLNVHRNHLSEAKCCIQELEGQNRNKDIQISELHSQLRIIQSTPCSAPSENEIMSLRNQVQELGSRLNLDSDHYNNVIIAKDRELNDLRAKFEMELAKPVINKETVVERAGQAYPVVDTNQLRAYEDKLRYLEEILMSKDGQIDQLSIQLSQKPHMEIVHPPHHPVEVVQAPPLREVVYERDPYLIERNKQLAEELERTLLNEQKMGAELAMRLEEISRLHCLIEDLKAMPPQQIRVEVPVERRVTVTSKLGPAIERYLELYNKNKNLQLKEAIFAALYYYKNFRQYLRLSHTRREKVIVNQTLEVYDGTQEVWNFYRQS